jgi:hypothetical protein
VQRDPADPSPNIYSSESSSEEVFVVRGSGIFRRTQEKIGPIDVIVPIEFGAYIGLIFFLRFLATHCANFSAKTVI